MVYDTGALIGAERNRTRVWGIHQRATSVGVLSLVPAGVLAEAWRGGPAPLLSRFLRGTEVIALDERSARGSGLLLARAGGGISAVDATVVDVAVRANAAIVTSDPDDIRRLVEATGVDVPVIEV